MFVARAVRLLALSTVVLLLALGAAACGGDSDSGSASKGEDEPKRLSGKAYIEQVNEVQEEFATTANELDLANPKDAADFQTKLQGLVGPLEQLSEDLDEIEPPKEVEEQHEELIAAMDDYREAIVDNEAGLTGSKDEVSESATEIADASTEFSQKFDETITEINDELGVGDEANS